MKIVYYFSLILSLCVFITSCEKSNIKPQEELIEVSFGLSIPFITTNDELLTKSGADNNYTYGISIEIYNETIGSYEIYAGGLFDDITKANITLYKTRKYNIKALVINNFFNGGNFFHSTDNGIPFYESSVTNSFEMNRAPILTSWSRKNVFGDAYYGALTEYSPSNDGVCNINLKSETSGIKIAVNGTNKGGIQIKFGSIESWSNDINFSLSETSEYSSYITFSGLIGSENNTIDVGCKFFYIDEDNYANTLEENSYTFSKGYRKIFNININKDNNSTEDTGFNFSFNTAVITDETPIDLDFSL